MLALPLAMDFVGVLYSDSGDAPLVLCFIVPFERGASFIFWFALDPELEGGGSVKESSLTFIHIINLKTRNDRFNLLCS